MGFTTQIFTFICLPIALGCYYLFYFLQKRIDFLKKIRITDLAVILLSFAFYAWACFDNIFWLLFYILLVYVSGFVIGNCKKRKSFADCGANEAKRRSFILPTMLLIFCALLVGILVAYKYSDIASNAVNFFAKASETKSVVAPLGISFITFSAISYLVDIYKGKAESGDLIDCALYLSLFTKVVSGPIVLWRDFKNQTATVNLTAVSEGMLRVMAGYAKKVILADTFGLCISKIDYAIDVPTAWGMAILYFLQIYYDFSGYSDIAIGLSKMMGYDFEENFNFPYLSTSISEFWRRWHISLGRWFREYVYISLGGSRKGKLRTVVNIAVVFILTGIWHGAGWTYMLWGIANGICNIIEKLIADKKVYIKTPTFVKWFFTTGVTLFCWQLFRAPDIRTAARWIFSMFGLFNYEGITHTVQYYFDAQITVLTLLGILGATVFGLPCVQEYYKKLTATKGGYLLHQTVMVLLFILAIMFMVNSTYSPFLYFQY